MPAPLARGLILSLTLLFAAGYAVYENPQVRAWVDERRRQLTAALSGEDISPQPIPLNNNRTFADDVSIREDNSFSAVERRRLARQQILERAAAARAQRARKRGASFDDLVDQEGNLRASEKAATSSSDATGHAQPQGDIRNRRMIPVQIVDGSKDAGFASAAVVSSFNSGLSEDDAFELARRNSSSESSTLDKATPDTASSATFDPRSPPATQNETQNSQLDASHILVDVDTDVEEAATPLELTPTTSRAPSSFHPAVLTPGSAAFSERLEELMELHSASHGSEPRSPPISVPDELSYPSTPKSPSASSGLSHGYASIREWAERSLASLENLEDQERPQHGLHELVEPEEGTRTPVSEAPSLLSLDEAERQRLRDEDGMSDFDEVQAVTPHSWTDIGSVVSGEEIR